jgi:uncharacterized membrane protein YqhA
MYAYTGILVAACALGKKSIEAVIENDKIIVMAIAKVLFLLICNFLFIFLFSPFNFIKNLAEYLPR